MQNPFISRTFDISDDVHEAIDAWLNGLAGAGIGMAVVGYVMDQGRVLITVKRWKLSEAPRTFPGMMQRPQPVVIDETFEDPSIQVGEEEVSSTHHG